MSTIAGLLCLAGFLILYNRQGKIMASQAELAQALTALTEQAAKEQKPPAGQAEHQGPKGLATV